MSSTKFLKLLLAGLLFLNFPVPPAFSHVPGPPKKGEVGRKTVDLPAPDFTLVDQEGKPFSFAAVRGKVVLVTFIFTTCPDFCPILTSKLTQIQRQLEANKEKNLFFLSVTTDPDTDKPPVLKSYAEQYRANLRSWAFLTGDKKSVAKVWDAFGIRVKKLPNGQIQHTGLVVLIDRKGMRRVNYYGDTWDEKAVLKDIAELASEN